MDNDLIDMIASDDGSASDVHDKIKDLLYAKSAENIETIKPAVTASMFGGPNPYLDIPETEVEPEVGEPLPDTPAVDPTDEAPGTPASVEDSEVETPTAEVEVSDNEPEEEKPEA